MSLPLGPLGPPRGGHDPGRNAKAGNGEMTFDRRVAGAIEALEFLRRHMRTDKVILLAESMGTLTGGPWSGAGPTERWDLGPGTQIWSGRSEPAAYAEPGPQAALAARGARFYRSDKVDRLVGVESAGRTGRGFCCCCASSRANCRRKRLSVVLGDVSDAMVHFVVHALSAPQRPGRRRVRARRAWSAWRWWCRPRWGRRTRTSAPPRR
jgi:hypothetical protein